MIDFSPLTNALRTLDEAVAARAANPTDKFIRDACIQRFEYCYELSHKMLRRYLAATEASPSQITELSFPELIRLGWQRGLVPSEWAVWREFRDARNITSHGYDEAKAERVTAVIPRFLDEATALVREMADRQEKGR